MLRALTISGKGTSVQSSVKCVQKGGFQREYNSLATFRRLKNKSKVGGLRETDDEYYEVERLGNTFLFNQLLAEKFNVIPFKDVFRNLHTRRLVQYSQGTLDKNRALHVNVPNEPLPFHVKEKDNALVVPIYKKLLAQAKTHLGFNHLFTRDASVGGHSWAQVPVRVMTDSAALDLSLSTLLNRVPLRTPEEQPVSLTVYVASSLDKELSGKKSFAIFDPEFATLLVVGPTSSSALRDAIGKAAASVHAKKFGDEGLYLNADVVSVKDKNVVVFNKDNLLANQKLSSPFFSARGAFWTHNGLVKAWNGALQPSSSSSPLSFGNLVENAGKESFVAVPLSSPNACEHPSAVVFLVNDAKNSLPTLSKLNPTQAAQYFLGGYNGSNFTPFFESLYHGVDPNGIVSRFKNLVENMGVNCYVLNNAGPKGLSSQELEKILTSVADGSASRAPTLEGFSLFSPITSLPGFKNVPTSQGNPQSSNFEKELSAFLQQKFPSVQF